jgi:3-phosphoshikimate 1-carboxyvinyltransferase
VEYLARPAANPLQGVLRVPGDKSLSHRAVLFSAMAEGTSHLTGVLDSEDVRSTIDAVRALGADVELVADAREAGLAGTVTGWGARGPLAPDRAIDCGNSGTTARLLLGVLAGWPIAAVLKGDESLTRRPMNRVTAPLERMGAHFSTHEGRLPVTVRGGSLVAIDYDSPVASAQVKSAVLLAGLRAKGRTTVTEPAPSRDHTERLLPAFGVSVERDSTRNAAWVDGPATLKATDVEVPGDPSSAAFFLVAALIVPGSDLTLENVALNPTRTGFLRVLERMGARVSVDRPQPESAGARDVDRDIAEPVGSIRALYTSGLRATVITAGEVPALIDEIPVLALAASQALGTTRFEGVEELRVKESDRLAAVEQGLSALGVGVKAGADWLEVSGPANLTSAALDTLGDHRLAMTWAMAGLAAAGSVAVTRFEAVDVSYPGFARDVARLTGLASDLGGM